MSAFGKRGGVSGARPNFGVAKPMKGGHGGAPVSPAAPEPGGDQFPPLDDLDPSLDATGSGGTPKGAAMDRLTARQNASGDAGSRKVEGLEASVHRIQE